MDAMSDQWVTIKEAARLVGEPERTMRRRLNFIARERPQLGLFRRISKQRYLVSMDALRRALTTDPGLRDSELDAIHSHLHQIDRRVAALRAGHRRLREQVSGE